MAVNQRRSHREGLSGEPRLARGPAGRGLCLVMWSMRRPPHVLCQLVQPCSAGGRSTRPVTSGRERAEERVTRIRSREIDRSDAPDVTSRRRWRYKMARTTALGSKVVVITCVAESGIFHEEQVTASIGAPLTFSRPFVSCDGVTRLKAHRGTPESKYLALACSMAACKQKRVAVPGGTKWVLLPL